MSKSIEDYERELAEIQTKIDQLGEDATEEEKQQIRDEQSRLYGELEESIAETIAKTNPREQLS